MRFEQGSRQKQVQKRWSWECKCNCVYTSPLVQFFCPFKHEWEGSSSEWKENPMLS